MAKRAVSKDRLFNFKYLFISVDESLIHFRGRYSDKQYIPSKSAKYGIKFYSLCESSTGYLIDWLCHADTASFKTNYTENIVLSLVTSAGVQKGQVIYTDNFYTSPSLANELMKIGIGFCGTCRPNRKGLPEVFKNNKMNKNSPPQFMRKNELCCVQWHDKKTVIALSSHIGKGVVIVNRKTKDGVKPTNVPDIIDQYNQYMRGVDLCDQRLHYEAYPHRCNNWPQVIWHLFRQLALNNGYVVFKIANPSNKLSSRDFRLNIVDGLFKSTPIFASNQISSSRCAQLNATAQSIGTKNGRSERKYCAKCNERVTAMCSVCKQPFCTKSTSMALTCFQRHGLPNSSQFWHLIESILWNPWVDCWTLFGWLRDEQQKVYRLEADNRLLYNEYFRVEMKLAQKDQQLAAKDQQLAAKDQQLAAKDREIAELKGKLMNEFYSQLKD